MTFHFIVTVWGDGFVEMFLNLCLPNQLTPGNLRAFQSEGLKTDYIIYTTEKDRERMLGHEHYQRLAALMPVAIHTVDFLVPSSDYVYSASLMTRCHQIAIPLSSRQGAYLVFLPPDQLYSEGALARLIDIARAGKRVVLVSGVRLRGDTFRPAFEAAFTDCEGDMPAPARPLVALGLQHLHPMAQSYRVDSRTINDDANQLYWPVGDEGFIASSFVSHPLMVKPRNIDAVPFWVLDGDYPILACPSFRDYHLVTDSDEMVAFELSPRDKRNGIPAAPRRFNVFRYAMHVPRPYNRIHRRIAQEMVRIHTGDMNAEWDAVEARARKTAFAMRLLVAGGRMHPRYPQPVHVLQPVHDLNAVRRVAIFGARAGGALAKTLADRYGWEVTRWVDNDAATWGSVRNGITVTNPAGLRQRDFDVVIVASMAGKTGIFAQLDDMGLHHGKDYFHFHESVSIGGFRLTVHIP